MAASDAPSEARPIELLVYVGAVAYIVLFVYSIVEGSESTRFLADLAFGGVIVLWGIDLLTAGEGRGMRIAGASLILGGLLQAGITAAGVTGVVENAPVVLVLLGVILYFREQSI